MRKQKGLGVREIAARLNVNISTVSRALNNDGRISMEMMSAVHRMANELGYHPKTRKTIAIILPATRCEFAWYTLNLLNALTKSLEDKEYYWEFINSDKIDILLERSLCGLISIDFNQHIAREISRKFLLPLVCINDAPDHLNNVFSVNSDASSAITLAFQCLYNYGHRKIAFLSHGSASFSGKRRKEIFLKIAEKYKLEDQCRYLPLDDCILHGAISNFYEEGITGIIADGESQGITVLNSLKYCKIPVPRKMSLITWEMPYVSQFMDPSITTVSQDFDSLAENAVNMLETILNKKIISEDVLVPYHLNLRASVALPRK